MFFQLRHVFAGGQCFYRCAIIFCVFRLRQFFLEQDSLGIGEYFYFRYLKCLARVVGHQKV